MIQKDVQKTAVHLVSLGCPKNLVDSEVMLGILDRERYTIVPTADAAQVIIVNTCSFVRDAKEESIAAIFEMSQLKESGSCQLLIVCGCLSQRYSADLPEEMPEVDLFVGTGQYHRIAEFIRDHFESPETLPSRTYVDDPRFLHTENDPRLHTGAFFTSFLKISEGCDRYCSFCIIPEIRGRIRSRTVESLVAEAHQLAQKGVRELNLIAQDLTEFGKDRKYSERLETLLPALCRVEGVDWIRLHYVYPDEFSDELIDIIAREPKIVKYLDIPIQHTNDRLLKLMNRRLDKKRIFDLVGKLRARVPALVFRTSIIVGFPGETDKEFQELCYDLEKLNLDHVGVFQYSQEEGTKAATLPGQIHAATKRKRERKLCEVLEAQSLANQQKHVGQRVPVLIEGPSEESELLIQGRMSTQAADIDGHVLINELSDELQPEEVKPGVLVEVEIVEAMPHDLVGRAVRIIS